MTIVGPATGWFVFSRAVSDAQNLTSLWSRVFACLKEGPRDMLINFLLTFLNTCRAGYVNLRRHSYRSCGRPLPGEKCQVLGYVCYALPFFGGRLGPAQRGTSSVLYFCLVICNLCLVFGLQLAREKKSSAAVFDGLSLKLVGSHAKTMPCGG